MTIALGGRLFKIGSERKSFYDYSANRWRWHDVELTRCVPNGTWVMEGPTHGWSWLVGITPDELDGFDYINRWGDKAHLYFSDKPFGYICTLYEEDVDQSVYPPVIKPTGRKTLVCAQQIHLGEIGSTVPIPRLNYVRQAFKPGTKQHMNARDRKRSNMGWVRLTDLVEASGLGTKDVVFGYWQYSGHRNCGHENDQVGGQLLDMVVASSADEISGQYPTVHFTTQHEAARLIQTSLPDLWVRRGFSYTVLRLRALNVSPEILQHL